MAKSRTSAKVHLQVERLEEREVPSVVPSSIEAFDLLAPPALPTNWQQWTSAGNAIFATSSAKAFSGGNSLASNAASNVGGRIWRSEVVPADRGVQATILADSLIPVQVFARGQDLNTSTPDYYAVSITRGLQVDLIKVVDGVSTTLATLKTKAYLSNAWIRVSLTFEGDQLAAQVVRADTSQFLDAQGNWVAAETSALQANDGALTGGGQVGIARPPRYAGATSVDDFAVLVPVPTTVTENFNNTPTNGVPTGWSRWSSDGAPGFGPSTIRAIDGVSLTSAGISTRASRAWANLTLPANTQAVTSIYVDSLVPAQLLVRGSKLDSIAPTYYALSVTRGLGISLIRVTDGVTTTLAGVATKSYTSDLWLRVSLTVEGNHLQARVQRLDDGRWLNSLGEWQSDPAAALDAFDNGISGTGMVGLARPSLYAGSLYFDNFSAKPNTDDITAPTLQVTVPNGGQNLNGILSLSVTAQDSSGITKVVYMVDDLLVAADTMSPWTWALDTRNFNNGVHDLIVRAYDTAGNVQESRQRVTFANKAPFDQPVFPQHYSHIRVAQLAYSGNPMGVLEKQLLQNSVDLVVPNAKFLSIIDQTSSATPQLIYSNVSNLYQELLTDWLAYADGRGASRELAFYHVTQPTAWTGASASSQPVTWFWNAELGPVTGASGFKKLTGEARDGNAGDVTFGAAGQAIYLGYTEEFREINVTMSTGKQAGWSSVLEYATAVDAAGNPTNWKTLPIISDATNGLAQSGRITFDPPSDWVAALVPGSTAKLYYVRIRTTTGTAAQAPVATSILGRDYVAANGGFGGIIPAFDSAADQDGDGYLNDAEYATRTTGKDARFIYESRLFYPYYGSMRFVTNPASTVVQDWAANYHQRLLAANPLADGIFMDNSSGKNPIKDFALLESNLTYTADYAALLSALNRQIAPRWVMANTSNGGPETDQIVRVVPGTMEEFAIRAMSSTWSQFQDLAATIARRQAAIDPAGYLVIDSLSTGGAPTNWRTQLATLSYYYMIGDPKTTFFMPFGGEEPASSWSRHWFNAIAYNIGQPLGGFSVFATGADRGNMALTYNIYQRSYENALVLYKPLSYALGKGTGTTADNSATTHQLGGSYHVLNVDGSVGAPVTSITLRNGEGVILIRN